ncbi:MULTISPECIES: alpha/beta hydrolase family esterase [unclassified Curtobacterium]|uniref:alpha/beta hydrolase family esterase n=1 Tax=unclassified Curtobacterium TaxID=257496 RepID=UPI003A7F9095
MTDSTTPSDPHGRRPVIPPGTPDEDNRDFLPPHLRGTNIVVNENGNNSQPYPAELVDLTDLIGADTGIAGVAFVPHSARAGRDLPLVISLHGGMMAGWGQAVYSSWTLVAEREGFVVVFPDASVGGIWALSDLPAGLGGEVPGAEDFIPAVSEENPDEAKLLRLIDAITDVVPVDRARIYVHGMSMGHGMADQFARHHGHLLAGVAGSAGATSPRTLNDEPPQAAVPVWSTQVEFDDVPTFFGTDRLTTLSANRAAWATVNEVESTIPVVTTDGVDTVLHWRGARADVVLRDVAGRDHGQPLDDAEQVWAFFAGLRRGPDGIESTGPNLAGDAVNLIVADGSRRAILDQQLVAMSVAPARHQSWKYHGLEGNRVLRADFVTLPTEFLAKHFGTRRRVEDAGASVSFALPDGREVRFARGSVACLIDGRVVAMPVECIERDGDLLVPAAWFLRTTCGWWTSERDGVLYATDHWCELSVVAAAVLRDALSTDVTP